ncbi:MAG: transposase [Thermomicrobiales bacterium]
MARICRRYSPEFKQEALALVALDHSVTAVARELGIPGQTLSMWVNAERKQTAAAELAAAGPVDPAVHRAALQRIAELERENEFLGKVSAFFASKTRP